MKEDDVIKALGWHTEGTTCKGCPAAKHLRSQDCIEVVMTHALAMIDNKNERLERYARQLDAKCDHCIEKAKAAGARDFAKFLIDKSENGVIHISDLPDYVVEKNKEVGNARNNFQR